MRTLDNNLRYIAFAVGVDPSQNDWRQQVQNRLLNDPEMLANVLFDIGFTPYLLTLLFIQRWLHVEKQRGLIEKVEEAIETAIESLPQEVRERAQLLWYFGDIEEDIVYNLSQILRKETAK